MTLTAVSVDTTTERESSTAMTGAGNSEGFYAGIPVFRGFGSLMDPALYSALPDDWTIGVADIVESTRAIAEKRYKAVNMAGAAVDAGGGDVRGGGGGFLLVGRGGGGVLGFPGRLGVPRQRPPAPPPPGRGGRRR